MKNLLTTCKIIASITILFCMANVQADEGGSSFWGPGQYAAFAAVPEDPGWTVDFGFFDYTGSLESQAFTRGRNTVENMKTRGPLFSVEPIYAPKTPIFGGQLALSVGIGYGYNWTEADIGPHIKHSDTDTGLSDIAPSIALAWTQTVNNEMLYITGNIPSGSYSSEKLSSIGIGHSAIDGGAGYTYYNEDTGLEGSIVAGLTSNKENHSTQYKSGLDSHVDYDLSEMMTKNFQVGLAGYFFYQLTGDSGSGAQLTGPFRSRVAGLGPEVGYMFTVADRQWYFNLRGYAEFWAKNRPQGYDMYAELDIPLSQPASQED